MKLHLCLSIPALATVAHATDWYVAKNGDDRWSGKLAAPNAEMTDGPFETVYKARNAVREAIAAIARAERENGVTTPIHLLLNLETPYALRDATALASADPRVMGLQVGLGDLFEPFGIDRRDTANVHQVLFAVRMAAAEAGVAAYDGAFADVGDTDGYLAEAQQARRLGFEGKTCIHPSQVALANQAFRPTDAEIAHAVKVLAASADADRTGTGAYMVDGKMIDPPFFLRAQAIVASAKRLGLLPAN